MSNDVTVDKKTILSSVLYGIDVAGNSIKSVAVNASLPDLEKYLANLLKEIGEQDQKRSYKFQSPRTEFCTCLNDFNKNKNLPQNNHAPLLATRLLKHEIEANRKYKNINKVSKGSFLQFMYSDGGQMFYLSVKVEHQSFLDETDFIKKYGLAEDRKLYKACKVQYKPDGTLGDVSVFDTNGVAAAYWWREFLELEVIRDDAENTKNAVEAVLQTIGSLKSKYPSDHTILRNAAVAAFKQQAQMNYFNFVDTVFNKYKPTDEAAEPDIKKLVEKLKELPGKKNFDTQFELVPGAVPFKQTKYNLSSEITLTIKDGITNISDKIWAEVTKDGRNVVVIESDQAHNFSMKKR